MENGVNKTRERDNTRMSKTLSYVLRHKPDSVGVVMDEKGWVDVEDLIDAILNLTKPLLDEIVESNNKKRFEYSEDGTKIRARQGHTLDVDVELEQCVPPEVLFHGTAEKNASSIKTYGLHKAKRNHVHLSWDAGTATNVGSSHILKWKPAEDSAPENQDV